MKKILGLAAKARSGKDTAASILLANPGVAAYALADPLKRGCQALFALSDAETWDDTVKEKQLNAWGQSPREFFQRVGTEWMRGHDPLHWLKRADLEINGLSRISVEGHSGTALSPHVSRALSATDADAPFISAVSAIFGLLDHSWHTDLFSVPDGYWGVSPAEMISLLKGMTYRDFPDFDAQRALHIENSKVKNSEVENSKLRNSETLRNNRHSIKQCQNNNPTFNPPVFESKGKDVIIIKDIRFENEAHFIRSLNGEIWHIIRDDAESVKKHSSEAGIEVQSQDTVIHNNGTLKNYKSSIAHAWATLQAKLAKEKESSGASENNSNRNNINTRI